MPSVLISDKGRELPASGAALGFMLEYPKPDFDIVGYAVRNCGWLHLRSSRRLLRIRLRPQGFSRAAYTAAVALMLEAEKGTRFVFDHEDGQLGTDVLLNLNDAIAHLEDLMSFAG